MSVLEEYLIVITFILVCYIIVLIGVFIKIFYIDPKRHEEDINNIKKILDTFKEKNIQSDEENTTYNYLQQRPIV